MNKEWKDWAEDLGQLARYSLAWARRYTPRRLEERAPFFEEGFQKSFVSRLHPASMTMAVKEVVRETETTATLRLERVDGLRPPFQAGQYLNVYLRIGNFLTSRPYSISSNPETAALDLTIRCRDRDYAPRFLLDLARQGIRLTTSGPEGHFRYEPLVDGDELVFLAGGSGITPFMSMLRSLALRGFPQRVQLVYGTKDLGDTIFLQELKDLQKRHKRFSLHLVVSEPSSGFRGLSGFLDADMIRRCVGRVDGKMFYLCGPGAFYDFVIPGLESLGVPRHRIRRELFGTPTPISRQPGWPGGIGEDAPVTIQVEGGRPFPSTSGEPLLNALEKAGYQVRNQCRSGECSACRVRIVSGKVYVPPGMGIREADVATGHTHSCVAWPITDVLVRL